MFASTTTRLIAAAVLAASVNVATEASAGSSTGRINAIIHELSPGKYGHHGYGAKHHSYGYKHYGRKYGRKHRRSYGYKHHQQGYGYGSKYRRHQGRPHYGSHVTKVRKHIARSYSFSIHFAPGSAHLDHRDRAILKDLGHALESRNLKGKKFLIVGHTDAVGSRHANQKLSEHRAKAVRHFLLSHFAISPKRLVATGLGEERLLKPGHPTSKANRRVEIVLVEPGMDLGYYGHTAAGYGHDSYGYDYGHDYGYAGRTRRAHY